MITNCPNCGAPIVGNECEYCGTIFNDIQEKYQFNHEREGLYLRLDLLHKLDQLNIERRNLEFQLVKQKIMNSVYDLK